MPFGESGGLSTAHTAERSGARVFCVCAHSRGTVRRRNAMCGLHLQTSLRAILDDYLRFPPPASGMVTLQITRSARIADRIDPAGTHIRTPVGRIMQTSKSGSTYQGRRRNTRGRGKEARYARSFHRVGSRLAGSPRGCQFICDGDRPCSSTIRCKICESDRGEPRS